MVLTLELVMAGGESNPRCLKSSHICVLMQRLSWRPKSLPVIYVTFARFSVLELVKNLLTVKGRFKKKTLNL